MLRVERDGEGTGWCIGVVLADPSEGRMAVVADGHRDDGDRLVDVNAWASSAGGGKCLPFDSRFAVRVNVSVDVSHGSGAAKGRRADRVLP